MKTKKKPTYTTLQPPSEALSDCGPAMSFWHALENYLEKLPFGKLDKLAQELGDATRAESIQYEVVFLNVIVEGKFLWTALEYEQLRRAAGIKPRMPFRRGRSTK